MGLEERSKQLRRVAFGGVVMSTVAVAACLVTFPMIFHFVQMLQADIESGVSLCKTRSRDLYTEVIDDESLASHPDLDLVGEMISYGTTHLGLKSPHALQKRQAYPTQQCCTCHRGTSGPPGPNGRNGRDGTPGASGRPGNMGNPAPEVRPESIYPPQCECETTPGGIGDAGSKGPPGPSGKPGDSGKPGGDGSPGNPGGKGYPGPPGKAGNKGPAGDKGVQQAATPGPAGSPGPPGTPGEAGPPGGPGEPGENGAPGAPGQAGSPAEHGLPGQNGDMGEQGNPGIPGTEPTCDHCPAVSSSSLTMQEMQDLIRGQISDLN